VFKIWGTGQSARRNKNYPLQFDRKTECGSSPDSFFEIPIVEQIKGDERQQWRPSPLFYYLYTENIILTHSICY